MGGGTEKERASNPPYPVQNDKDTHLSGTPASAAYAAKISLAVTVAKETVLENRGKKHSPEDQAPTAAAALLTTSAPSYDPFLFTFCGGGRHSYASPRTGIPGSPVARQHAVGPENQATRKTSRPRKGGHKGRVRQYTSPEEIDAQLQAEKQKANEEDEQEEGGDGASGDPKKEKKSLDSDESEDEDDDYQQKRKGVEGLIDIENPNRVAQTTKKVTQLDLDGPKELSRREREEIEKQKAKERYMKMHLAGKTEQAKADLARLAIIRKQREEAARKKEEERKAKDDATLSGKRMQSLSLNK
ncbi:28 kDa heat- and acid-stable phosphoprotein [Microtus ochrogaster]|uniref:28 kDa heat- and acid-stable phosphoprotein n=1 Tax=Microtus ochrogaster TaxID=79684 RepID=A0A8J6KVU6_MICOH|nr:28 kDa heat- and acid-stable phosphoprotein [Microtus ochrogaster]